MQAPISPGKTGNELLENRPDAAESTGSADEEEPVSDPEGRFSINADIDVDEVIAEIEGSIGRKLEAGAYPPEVLAELVPPDPDDEDLDAVGRHAASYSSGLGLPDGMLVDPFALTHLVAEVGEMAYVTPEVTTASQKALLAPAVSQTKRLMQKTLRWYITGVVEQINAFNSCTSMAMQVVTSRISSLSDELERLEEQVAEQAEVIGSLQQGGTEHGHRLEALRRDLEDLRSRLDTERGHASSDGQDG